MVDEQLPLKIHYHDWNAFVKKCMRYYKERGNRQREKGRGRGGKRRGRGGGGRRKREREGRKRERERGMEECVLDLFLCYTVWVLSCHQWWAACVLV